MNDFGEIEQLAGSLLRSLAPAQRRSLLRRMARDIQGSQSARIARQQDPDGNRFAPRKPRRDARPGNYALRFLYPKGAPEPRAVFLKSWVREGPLVTGFDIEAGAIRSFAWDKVAKFLPVAADEQNAGGGRFRRRGRIRQATMFRKLRNRRNLRAGASDREAWIGFTGRAAEIAGVHQDGRADRPSRNARMVRYAKRGLIGLTEGERNRALDMLLDHFGAAT